MPKVALVTDSTAYIPKDLEERYCISVAPQVLVWGPETYLDGVDIQPHEFYERLKTAKIMPTTSQASPQSFHDIFTRLLDEGHEVLAVLISTDLSGTVASAIQAREDFPGAPVEIVDSRSVAMGLGFQVLLAARAAEDGASLAECKALVENAHQHTGVLFTLETLEFLHRGGRIGGGTRLLGVALNLKPIMEVTDGHIEPVEKVRTRKKSFTRLVEIVEERIGDRKPVHMAALHVNARETAQEILDMTTERVKTVETLFSEVSPVVGTHAGPGTVGLAFMAGI